MITDLLGNLLELSSNSIKEVTVAETAGGKDSWITPQGEVISISAVDHIMDAIKILKGTGYKVPGNIVDYERILSFFGEKTGYIRMKEWHNELSFDIITSRVTRKQISTMKKLAESYSTVYFSIGTSMGGTGFQDMITELRRLGMIKESIDEQLHTGEWGFIDPSGKRITDIENHAVYAEQYLKKHKISHPKHEVGTIATFLSSVGYVRYYIENEQVGFSIVTPVTSLQLSSIRRISRKAGVVMFDIMDKKGNDLKYGGGISKLISTLKKMDLLEKILRDKEVEESSIDFPRKDLDPSVWLKEDDTYKIRPDVRRKILAIIGKYPGMDLIDTAAAGISDAATIHIVGSIGTNQFLDDSDMDVHIVVSKDSDFHGDVDFQDKVIKWFNEHRDEVGGYIDKHPIEIYLQYDPDQDLMSDGCYDLLADKWLTGPKIVPLDFDPYEDFSGIADDLRNAVEYADRLFGELKRDVIDYSVIEQAMNQLSPEQKELFLGRLKSKLEEIEEDIKALYMKRKEWVDARRMASKPSNPEEALKDVELARRWKDQNALFKFVNRYQYLKTIKALEKLLADDEISPSEVDTIRGIVGGV